jgi:hypothetical protein
MWTFCTCITYTLEQTSQSNICVGQFNHQNYLGTRCKPNSLSVTNSNTCICKCSIIWGGGAPNWYGLRKSWRDWPVRHCSSFPFAFIFGGKKVSPDPKYSATNVGRPQLCYLHLYRSTGCLCLKTHFLATHFLAAGATRSVEHRMSAAKGAVPD